MKNRALLFVLGLAANLALSVSDVSAVVLAGWNFETSIPATAGPHAAEEGTGSALGFHASGSTYSNPVGNGSGESFSSNTWATGDYYQFTTSTLGFENITLSWDQTSSSTGPTSFSLQYSTDGTSFFEFTAYSVGTTSWSSGTPQPGSGFSYDLSSITALANVSVVYFRLTSTITPGNTAGTSRVDNFVINGDVAVIPEPTGALLLGAAGLSVMFMRRRRKVA